MDRTELAGGGEKRWQGGTRGMIMALCLLDECGRRGSNAAYVSHTRVQRGCGEATRIGPALATPLPLQPGRSPRQPVHSSPSDN